MNPDSPVNPSTPADIPAKADTEVRLTTNEKFYQYKTKSTRCMQFDVIEQYDVPSCSFDILKKLKVLA